MKSYFLKTLLISCCAASLAACGGGGGGGGGNDDVTVSTNAGNGGAIAPSRTTVQQGSNTSFTVTTDTGFDIDSITGCSGSLSGDTYTTGNVTSDCTVTITFITAAPTVAVWDSPESTWDNIVWQ
ncbi:MAG: hypothetical protein ACJAUP_001637 [Cellvibrionaceae bacterium]|jgi:hypothetical protein